MLRTALIGFGGYGARLAREIVDDPNGRLSAVVDIDSGTLDRASKELDLDRSNLYTDERTMYEETALDAVVIATPPAFHDDQIHEAFDRGLNVLCEKPVVVRRPAAERLRDRVAESDLTFMAGYQRHLNPGFIRARERYQGDHVPSHVVGELTQNWTAYFKQGTNWRTDPDIGGRGHLFSVGTHVVESVLWLTGLRPVAVSAEMEFHDDANLIDKKSSMTVRFANGAVGTFADSAVAPVTREHIHVWDDDGAVYLDGEGWGRRALTVIDATGGERQPDLPYDESPTKFGVFAESALADTEPPATADDVLAVTALLDAAYESAPTGERVEIDPVSYTSRHE
ncbi:MAG: Gfo/Idh/MocA family protein [Halobacteriales archaeon]